MEILSKILRRSVTIREIPQKQKISGLLTFTYLEKKSRFWKLEKLREKNMEIMGEKLSDKSDLLREKNMEIMGGKALR